jgi:glycopeptide antibiotics resistance protein
MVLFITWYYFIIVAIYLGIRLTTFKKDRFRIKKVALEVIFLVYCTAIVDLTLFPIEYAVPDTPLPPEVEAELARNGSQNHYNFIPFASIAQLLSHLSSDYYTPVIKNILGNLFLLSPMGFMLPMISRSFFSYKKIWITGFIITLTIECMQLLLSFLFGTGYRSFDIDDIILNVLGINMGFVSFLAFNQLWLHRR